VLLLTLDMREKKVVHFIQTGVVPGTLPPIPYEELLVGLTGWVLRERRPALSPKNTIDPRESPEVQKRRETAAAGSILVVPLIYRGRVLGTITATNEIENPDFTEADADLMLAMANQAAVAIQNALLLEETQKTAENERLLNQIASQLTQSLDFETVLQTALQQIAQLPHVSEVSLTLDTPANGAGNKR
jgi:GAF domain-containing protein